MTSDARPLALLVEDHPTNQKLARVLLELDGFAVHTAEDGAQVLAAADSLRPAVVLIDIQLPGMDGVALCRALRGRPAYAQLPFIAVTAYAMAFDREHYIAEGFDDYIGKPLDQREFARQVRRIMDAKRRPAGEPPPRPAH